MKDWSVGPYTGAMLDVARQINSVDDIKDVIVLLRLYKGRYLHIHFTDDAMWTLPSRAFPKLGLYKEAEIRDLVAFAEARGVTIVPELELTGHSSAIRNAYPEVFGNGGLNVLNMINETMYEGLDKIIAETVELFPTSPYVHVGCDEANMSYIDAEPATKEYLQKNHIPNVWKMYENHVARLHEMVRKHNRKMIVWQDCPLGSAAKDVIVMVWHIDYNHGASRGYMDSGRDVIQVTWTPCVYQSVQQVYTWSPWSAETPVGPHNLGSQMLLWERPGAEGLLKLRWKVPPRNELTYSTTEQLHRDYSDFGRRLRRTDVTLDALLTGVQVTESPDPVARWMEAGGNPDGEGPPTLFMLAAPFKVTMTAPGDCTIRYTLDGKDPGADSPRYEAPFTISEARGSERAMLRAAAFDAVGKPIGRVFRREYLYKPFTVKVEGTVSPQDFRFGRSARVTPQDVAPSLTIRYETGAEVTGKSPAVNGSVVVAGESDLVLRAFGADGVARGQIWRQHFSRVNFEADNLTRGRAVTGDAPAEQLKLAVDGVVDPEQAVHLGGAKPSLTIALAAPAMLDGVTLFTPWANEPVYQYTVEFSEDGSAWKAVADGSKNDKAASPKGYRCDFAPARAGQIRVTLLGNSRGGERELLEVRAYGPGRPDPSAANAPPVPAAFAKTANTCQWIGGADIYWSNAKNWSPAAPGAGDTVVFDAAKTKLELEGDRAIGDLVFSCPGGSIDAPGLVGWNTLYLAPGGLVRLKSIEHAGGVYCNLSFPGQALIEIEPEWYGGPMLAGRITSKQGLLVRQKSGVPKPRWSGAVTLGADNSRTLSGPVTIENTCVMAGSAGAFGATDKVVLLDGAVGHAGQGTIKLPLIHVPVKADGKSNRSSLTVPGFQNFQCDVQVEEGNDIRLHGGGNEMTLIGAIRGKGSVTTSGGVDYALTRCVILGGEKPNTASGTLTIAVGSAMLSKPAGVAAHSGPLQVGADECDIAILNWNANDQLPDATPVTLAAKANAGLELHDYQETLGPLTLQCNATIDLGKKDKGTKFNGAILFADSHSQAWTAGKRITIRNFDAARNRVGFGLDGKGLAAAQLQAIVFENPAGKAPGLYKATLGEKGLLAVGEAATEK
ncbi:MAG: family 20 glycosylhydrolase [Planctomycetota bacterium]|nr:family 20 glycosylhydrolase [Planctomycetota bacterium]